MAKIIEWMDENPSGNFDRMWSAVAKDKFDNQITRQTVKKIWDKSIKQITNRAQRDQKFQDMLIQVSHGLKAATVQVEDLTVTQIKTSKDGWAALVDLEFRLAGSRIASQDPEMVCCGLRNYIFLSI